MKRALPLLLIGVGTLAMLVLAVMVGSTTGWKGAGRQPWPASLGTLEQLPAHFPKREPSAEALRLAELARPLGIDFKMRKSKPDATRDAIAAFVHTEHVRNVPAIGGPPALVAAYVAKHEAAIDAVRDHILRSREIAWTIDLDKKFDAPLPNLLAHLNVVRVLVARALIRARSGDAAAWEDLRAAFLLERSLQPRPELISQLIALSLARSVNAAAWKLPLPAPGWLAELHADDHRRLLLRGLQYETWGAWRHGPDELNGPVGSISRPYARVSMGNLALHQREAAFEIMKLTVCRFDGNQFFQRRRKAIPDWNIPARIAVPNIGSSWSRALRYEAEREATANALRARAGEPVIAQSRCSDGSWRFDNGRLSFTGEIPPVGKHEMPLALSLR